MIALPTRPLIVAGGSLTARNERLLLSRYPDLLVARGAGEPTIQDVLAYWHGDLERAQIRGVGYLGAARGAGTLTIATARLFWHTANVGNRLQTDILPELDLLDATFRHKGVAQLESSRGCTNYCSFCPRSHKGQWSGTDPRALPWMLAEMGSIFRRYPELSRTIYLVDEEFIGRDEHAVARALAVASTLHQAGFQRETSCRVDQVVRLDQDRDWRLDAQRCGGGCAPWGCAAACSASSPAWTRSWSGSTRKPPASKTHSPSGEHATLLQRELDRWLRPTGRGWTLINAADPCGT